MATGTNRVILHTILEGYATDVDARAKLADNGQMDIWWLLLKTHDPAAPM